MSDIILPCLSIQQPWAWSIIHAGKDYENRTWEHDFRGVFLIHAGKTIDTDGIKFIREESEVRCSEMPEGYNTGGIVGIAEITDCVKKSDSKWFFGPYGFKIKNAMELPFYPCKGKILRFYDQSYPNREMIEQYIKTKDWKY